MAGPTRERSGHRARDRTVGCDLSLRWLGLRQGSSDGFTAPADMGRPGDTQRTAFGCVQRIGGLAAS